MGEANDLINSLRELNNTNDRSVARLIPSLIGLFGSPRMFELFLAELDIALQSGTIAPPLRERAANLTKTFIPQVAGYNNIPSSNSILVTAAELKEIRIDTPANRNKGVQTILAELLQILSEVNRIA